MLAPGTAYFYKSRPLPFLLPFRKFIYKRCMKDDLLFREIWFSSFSINYSNNLWILKPKTLKTNDGNLSTIGLRDDCEYFFRLKLCCKKWEMLRASVWRVEVMVGSIPASVTMGHHLTVAAKQKNNKVCIVRTWHQATATGDCLMVVKPKNDN